MFILMSRLTAKDYKKVFQVVRKIAGTESKIKKNLYRIMSDRAIRREVKDVFSKGIDVWLRISLDVGRL